MRLSASDPTPERAMLPTWTFDAPSLRVCCGRSSVRWSAPGHAVS
jgi:hypothetical protein